MNKQPRAHVVHPLAAALLHAISLTLFERGTPIPDKKAKPAPKVRGLHVRSNWKYQDRYTHALTNTVTEQNAREQARRAAAKMKRLAA